jgi:hypothetical protein
MRSLRATPVEVLRIEAEDLDAYTSPELKAISVRPLPEPTSSRGDADTSAREIRADARTGPTSPGEQQGVAPSDPAAAVWQREADEPSAVRRRRRPVRPDVRRLPGWAGIAAAALAAVVVANAVGDGQRIEGSQPPDPARGAVAGARVTPDATPRRGHREQPRGAPRRPREVNVRRRRAARRQTSPSTRIQPTAPASGRMRPGVPAVRAANAPKRPAPRFAPGSSAAEFGIEAGP